MILWTRVEATTKGDEPLAVQVARDGSFDEIVYSGIIPEESFGSETDRTVRIDLDGTLRPDTSFRYRFIHGDVCSRVGHCQTLPQRGTTPERVKFRGLYLSGLPERLLHPIRTRR